MSTDHNSLSDLLGSLALPPIGVSKRVSSNEQPNWNDGNFDSTYLQPGDVLEIPLLVGPGVINHLWFTSHAGGMGELNALTLRIYWDGRAEPGVEAPLGDFFAVGQRPAVVESVPVQVSPTGSLTCYWRMPFAVSARITVTNDNPDRGYGLYWQADWVALPPGALPEDIGYFHARYRQEYPAVMGRDYLLADIEGAGQYIVTVMTVTNAQDGWFGEGDDFFYVDGEEIPSLQGTGSEDYFNDAWSMRPRTSHWFGQPHWQGWRAGDGGVMYRWHIADAVLFHRSLKVTMEHKGNEILSEDAWYIERPDYFSSVAFWYQAGEPKPFGALPPYPERCIPWRITHLVSTFRHATVEGEATIKVQSSGMFGGRPALAIAATGNCDRIRLPFTIKETGRYVLRLTGFAGAGSAGFKASLDGGALLPGTITFRASGFDHGYMFPEASLGGIHELEAGQHELTLSPAASGAEEPCILGVETLRLLKLPAPAKRESKTRNEAHFYRIAIGRAVYAFRLAYGELPASLASLLESGILDARYLNDENDSPMESGCQERGAERRFVVRSTVPGGWEHSWLGLDARR